MKKKVTGFIMTLALVAAVATGACGNNDDDNNNGQPSGGSNGPGTASGVTVVIPANATGMGTNAYGTNPLVVPAGTAVTWTNQDTAPHTATSNSGVWDSGTLNSGQSFTFTFNDPGTFPYFCSIHGAASMSGTVQVTSATPSPSPTPTATPSVTPSPSPSPSPSASPSMVMVNIPSGATGNGPAAYGTNPLVISAGTTVEWMNSDSVPHTATSTTGVFDSGTLTQGQHYQFTFTTPGTYPYYCTIHGAASMSGVIRVQ